VDAVKYAPLGKRGVGLGGAHTDYLVPEPLAYFEESNRSSVVICQIESPKGLAELEGIAATPGVDCLWVGHFDLSQSMGIAAQFHHPDFLAALDKVVETAKKHGKLAGIQPGNLAQAEEWLGMGFNVISWSTDAAVYREALRTAVAVLRERLPHR
jgi:2-dehydro-3-deoxyglucarate aldolase/4-hydroxy-2-oxoheptanedioate aldolase